jgi:hypothetical protein
MAHKHLMVDRDTNRIIQQGEAYTVIRWDTYGQGFGQCDKPGCKKVGRTFVERYTPAKKYQFGKRRADIWEETYCDRDIAEFDGTENADYAIKRAAELGIDITTKAV